MMDPLTSIDCTTVRPVFPWFKYLNFNSLNQMTTFNLRSVSHYEVLFSFVVSHLVGILELTPTNHHLRSMVWLRRLLLLPLQFFFISTASEPISCKILQKSIISNNKLAQYTQKL